MQASSANPSSTPLTPGTEGFTLPAEWAPHESVWLAWPSAAALWQENLEPAQQEFVAFARAIRDVDPATKEARGEKLNILVPSNEDLQIARHALEGLEAKFHLIPFGDIWLRDTGPLFLKNARGDLATAEFGFNGWGGKYVLPHDADLARAIAKVEPARKTFSIPLILEGGSVEVDGEGTCLTSRQCLLNTNRNPSLNPIQIETRLKDSLGIKKILWVGDGLINDHTDGHIDTIVRFAPGGKLLVMESRDPEDPNREILEKIIRDLETQTDAHGRKFEIVKVPSPGCVYDEDDELMPASFVNFYIANTTVCVPTYGTSWDEEAVRVIASCFPGRRTIGLSARAILSGGGAFHCISQQQPS